MPKQKKNTSTKEFRAVIELGTVILASEDRNALATTISERLEPFFGFDSHVNIFVTQPDGKQSNFLNDISETEPKTPISPLWRHFLEMSPVFWDNLKGKGPQLLSLETILNQGESKEINELDGQQVLTIPLKIRSRVIGYLIVNNYEKDRVNESQFELFQIIADFLAVTLDNILTTEDIVGQSLEKDSLLSIGEEISKIREKDELFKAIMNRIKPILPFDSFVIVLGQRGGEKHIQWTANKDQQRIENKNFQAIHHKWLNTKGTPFEWLLGAQELCFITVEDLVHKWPNTPAVKLYVEMQMRSSACVPLRHAGEQLGVFLLHSLNPSFEKQVKPLILNSLSRQIATAVSNILADEEILERKREKETLLSVSKHFAAIRNCNDLHLIIMERIKPYLSFDHVVVISLDETFETCNYVLDVDTMGREGHGCHRTGDTPLSLNEPVLEAVFKKPDFQIISIHQEMQDFPKFRKFLLAEDTELNFSYKFNLNSGGRRIGILMLHYKHKMVIPPQLHDFVMNVVNQIATALSNILSNEALESRNEISAFQTNMADIFNFEVPWWEKYLKLSKIFQKWVPFDLIGYSLSDEHSGEVFVFEHIAENDYRYIPPLSLTKMCDVTLDQLNVVVRTKENPKPLFANGADFAELATKDVLKGMAKKYFGMKSCLKVPIHSEEGRLHKLVFFSRQSDIYQANHMDFIETIINSLKLILDKHLSSRKIMRLTKRLKQEKDYLQEEINITYNFKEIVGNSQSLKEALMKVQQVAKSNTTVLITGETGTGKELFARALHNFSDRKENTVIKLNCATLPLQLIESELFGHEKGSFTGADRQRIGKFELANGGTIFLDEIGEMPLEMQAKLLRVIQEKEFERLGGNHTIKVDVRIIAATNRDLPLEVEKGNFRADLYYRLNVFPIHIPALRERKEDITPLTLHFLKKSVRNLGKRINGVSSASLKELTEYHWPGNIRELEHIVERAVIVNSGSVLQINMDKMKMFPSVKPNSKGQNTFEFRKLKDAERELILKTLHFCNGRIRGSGGAAEILDINPQTLESRMKRHNIEKEHVVKAK